MMKAITIMFLAAMLLGNCSKCNSTNGIPVKEPSADIKAIETIIESFMQGYAFYGRFSGTILIANDDKKLYQNSFGYERSKLDILMKTFIFTKKLTGIWSEIKRGKGNFLGYNFYRIPGGAIKSSYWIRLVYEKKEVGLHISFRKKGKVMGMHIDQSFSFGGPILVEARVIDNKSMFIDGFKYGYPDAYIIQKEGNWILKTETAELQIDK